MTRKKDQTGRRARGSAMPAGPTKPKKTTIAARRARVAEELRAGRTVSEISAALGTPERTVFRDAAAVKKMANGTAVAAKLSREDGATSATSADGLQNLRATADRIRRDIDDSTTPSLRARLYPSLVRVEAMLLDAERPVPPDTRDVEEMSTDELVIEGAQLMLKIPGLWEETNRRYARLKAQDAGEEGGLVASEA
jgi:hypothetical protein